MKTLSRTLPLILATFLALASLQIAQAQDSANVSATLILGTNDGGGVDPQLQRYERNLKRVLRFDTFRQQGSGSTRVSTPGSSSIKVGGGNVITVEASDAGGGKLRLATRWSKGGKVVINTTVVTARNQPTVLVGPSDSGGNLILLLIAR